MCIVDERGRGRLVAAAVPLVLALLYVVFQFLTAEKFTNPVTGETHRVALSSDQEAQLGFDTYRQVLAQSEVHNSGPEYEMVRRVADRLAEAIGGDGEGFEWEVNLIESPEANAFCLPGGKIAVYTGILPVTQTEAGLAAVMGHEMAHAIARHGSQRIFQQQNVQAALMGVQGSLMQTDYDTQRTVMGLLGAGAQFGVVLPFSREHESEADYMGTLYMARAGYDPQEAIHLWERMGEGSQGQPPEFASTHPAHGTRIQQLKQWMPEFLREYAGARKPGQRSA